MTHHWWWRGRSTVYLPCRCFLISHFILHTKYFLPALTVTCWCKSFLFCVQHDLAHTQIKMARKQTPLSPQMVAHTRVHTTAISGWQADEGFRLVIFRGWDKCDVPVWEWCGRRHVGSPYPELLQKAFVVAGERHARIFALKSLLKFLAVGKAQGKVDSTPVLGSVDRHEQWLCTNLRVGRRQANMTTAKAALLFLHVQDQ